MTEITIHDFENGTSHTAYISKIQGSYWVSIEYYVVQRKWAKGDGMLLAQQVVKFPGATEDECVAKVKKWAEEHTQNNFSLAISNN